MNESNMKIHVINPATVSKNLKELEKRAVSIIFNTFLFLINRIPPNPNSYAKHLVKRFNFFQTLENVQIIGLIPVISRIIQNELYPATSNIPIRSIRSDEFEADDGDYESDIEIDNLSETVETHRESARKKLIFQTRNFYKFTLSLSKNLEINNIIANHYFDVYNYQLVIDLIRAFGNYPKNLKKGFFITFKYVPIEKFSVKSMILSKSKKQLFERDYDIERKIAKMRSNIYNNKTVQNNLNRILNMSDKTLSPKLKHYLSSLHFNNKIYSNINTHDWVKNVDYLLFLPPPFLPPHPIEIFSFEEKQIFKIFFAEQYVYKLLYIYCI